MHYLTTKIMFSSFHRLWNPKFSDLENEEIYQECFRGHGHNYVLEVTVNVLEVTVKGQPHPQTGMVMDIKRLNKLLMREVHTLVDHKSLNDDVEFLKGVIPTAENVSQGIWSLLKNKLQDADLYRIKLMESERNIVEYFGE
ncbi:MAG: 6-carboxytetrahydropterin synthase [Deltaproteobacteria bacterium]|nr:6-carboxytetrahydropterin synthase [Deltaproteobacteria bacterium]